MPAPAAGVPLLKLSLLVVKQVAKPLGSRVKSFARDSDAFRAVAESIGNRLHKWTLQLGRIADGRETLEHIRPLSAEAAVGRAGDFIAEVVGYIVVATTVVYEFRQASAEKADKEAAAVKRRAERWAEQQRAEARLRDEMLELRRRMTAIDAQFEAIRRSQTRAEREANEAHRQLLARQTLWGWFSAGPVPVAASAQSKADEVR